jgi:hypothetical protein
MEVLKLLKLILSKGTVGLHIHVEAKLSIADLVILMEKLQLSESQETTQFVNDLCLSPDDFLALKVYINELNAIQLLILIVFHVY